MAGYPRSACRHPGFDMRARPPRLPGYVLGPRLGGGPTCDVYSAVDEKRGRGWAVKVLRDEAAREPANLHLGPGRKATLLDLGFAHRPGEIVELLGAGYVLGTANYVAPELCDTPGSDGPAADLFSLGVTLFELLTGQLPYPDGGVS